MAAANGGLVFRKRYLSFILGFMVAAVFSVALMGLGVVAAPRSSRPPPVPRPPPRLQAPPQEPPEAPEEPSPEAPPPHGLSVATCWFSPEAEDLGEKCHATFTLCLPNAPTTCTQWLWITCRRHYVFIGPHTPSFSGRSLFLAGIPFATYGTLPILSLYFTNGGSTTGVFALYNDGLNLNRFGACLVIAGSGGPDPRFEALSDQRK
jgi:hypothetical protein